MASPCIANINSSISGNMSLLRKVYLVSLSMSGWLICRCFYCCCCFYCCFWWYYCCYIALGNMDNLTRSSKIWPKIKETLQKQGALDTHLTLRCQVHPSVFTRVSSAADFHKVPEGGCLQICGAALPCGHTCKSFCHVRNREHGNVRCSEQCERWGRVLHVWR